MIGFVYILVNDYMPGVCKIGCTERSPHERAAELSKGTGVPAPFDVLCYAEFDSFQEVEKDLHAWLNQWRISQNREFFHDATAHAVGWLWWYPKRLSFCAVPDTKTYGESLLTRGEFEDCWQGAEPDFHLLENPWAPVAPTAKPTEAPIKFDDFPDALPWEDDVTVPLKVVGGTDA